MKKAAPATVQPAPAIAQDIPCITCGYNLRGLNPSGLCPECGTPIQRSVDARTKLIMSSPKIWARLVLGGLVVWLALTPYFIAAALLTGPSISGNSSSLPWLNYPGPKVWAVPLVEHVDLGTLKGAIDFLKVILTGIMVFAIYLFTWPRHPGSGIEPPFNMRAAARWSSVVLVSGLLAVGLDPVVSMGMISPVWGTFAIALTELPCTLLVYRCLSTLARRLDLPAEAAWLRRCGWVAAFAMTVGVVMIVTEYPPRVGQEPYQMLISWCYGAINGTAAVVATGSLIRVAMALWPLATSKAVSSIR